MDLVYEIIKPPLGFIVVVALTILIIALMDWISKRQQQKKTVEQAKKLGLYDALRGDKECCKEFIPGVHCSHYAGEHTCTAPEAGKPYCGQNSPTGVGPRR